MLSEVIKSMVEHQPDMEVVGEVLDPIELLIAVREIMVDVVLIAPMKDTGEPRICRQLLTENPMLKIMTFSAEGKAAFLYQSDSPTMRIDEPSEHSILTTIRKSMQHIVDDSLRTV
ncbi:MAG: DNA-binding response regulator [Calditrichaeota bacterium]|nr:MAG: DNA-binding response regulator [Calditrichota bacterium]